MIRQQYFGRNAVLIVALLFLHCSDTPTIALVQNRPFDVFKVRKQLHDNAYFSNSQRHRSPTVSVPRSSGRYAFPFLISNPQPPEEQDEATKNTTTTLSEDGNLTTAFTNSSSINTTTIQSNGVKKKQSSSKSYFPFSFPSPTTTPKKGPSFASAKPANKTKTAFKMNTYSVGKPKTSKKSSAGSTDSSATMLLNKSANETITVADLEVLLAKMQSASDVSGTVGVMQPSNVVSNKYGTFQITSGTKGKTASSSSSQVAFPQLSEVSATDIRRSTAFTGSILGMIIGTTILPNLWLVGMIAGIFYGLEITKDIATYNPANKNTVANFLITNATRLAKLYRKVVDGVKALWFLYKTGQLSYEYYKSYEKIDKRFAIQAKVDAWNRVFVEGKTKFDTWEKENEVGRKVLAGLRTAWLLDEESRKRAKGRSKYRVIQAFYDLKKAIKRMFKKSVKSTRTLLEDGGLETFWKGLQNDLRQEGSLSVRVGAVAAALVAVNVGGALFSLSAGFSNFLAIVAAVIWPSWTTELLSRAQEIWLDTQSSGSSEKKQNSGNFFEWIQDKYEEHSSKNMKEYRSKNSGFFGGRRPKRKRTLAKSKKRKPNRPTRRNQSSSWFGFGNGQKPRSGNVGTWGNYRNY